MTRATVTGKGLTPRALDEPEPRTGPVLCSVCAEEITLRACVFSERATLQHLVEPGDRLMDRKWFRATCPTCGTVMLEGVPLEMRP